MGGMNHDCISVSPPVCILVRRCFEKGHQKKNISVLDSLGGAFDFPNSPVYTSLARSNQNLA
jgi:hypothetical protein